MTRHMTSMILVLINHQSTCISVLSLPSEHLLGSGRRYQRPTVPEQLRSSALQGGSEIFERGSWRGQQPSSIINIAPPCQISRLDFHMETVHAHCTLRSLGALLSRSETNVWNGIHSKPVAMVPSWNTLTNFCPALVSHT